MNAPVDGNNINLTQHRRPLTALTGIRFLAAIYVVVFHSTLGARLVQQGHSLSGHFCQNGSLAVALFFLLSGFILSYTYQGRTRTPAERRRFWEARLARVWPVYLLSLIVTALVLASVPRVAYVIASTLMVQAWNPFDRRMWGAGNYVCWTLSVEAFFYLVFPWVQQRVEGIGIQRQVACLLGALAICVYFNTGAYTLGYPAHGLIYWIPLPLVRLPEFLSGVCLGNLFMTYHGTSKDQYARLRLTQQGILTYFSAALAVTSLCVATGRWCSLVLVPFTVLLFGLASETTMLSRVLSRPGFVLGGGISYSIYLLQTAAKDAAMMIADHLMIASSAFRMGLMSLLLLVGSYLSYKLMEEPARGWIRGAFALREARHTTTVGA